MQGRSHYHDVTLHMVKDFKILAKTKLKLNSSNQTLRSFYVTLNYNLAGKSLDITVVLLYLKKQRISFTFASIFLYFPQCFNDGIESRERKKNILHPLSITQPA